jgi:tetratricopeptide (TPR) repeat protein
VPSWAERTALGDLLEALEPGPAAQQHYLVAMEQIDVLAATGPAVMQHHADAAGVRHSLGNWHLQRQQLDEAESAFRVALERRTLLAKEHPEVSELCRDMARTHNTLGVGYRQANRLDEAAAELRTVVALFEGLAKKETNEPEHRFELARAHVNLGSVKRPERSERRSDRVSAGGSGPGEARRRTAGVAGDAGGGVQQPRRADQVREVAPQGLELLNVLAAEPVRDWVSPRSGKAVSTPPAFSR